MYASYGEYVKKESGIGYQNLQNYWDDKIKRYDSVVVAKNCKILGCKLEELLELEENNK